MKKQMRSSLQNLSISYELALAIGNSLNLSEMLQEVIHRMVHKTNAHRGIIWVRYGEKKLQPMASAGISIEDVLAQGEIMNHRDVLNQIQKREQFVLKCKDDNDFLQYCPVLTEKEEFVLIVPITNLAVLYLVYSSREIADESLANLLTGLSKKLSIAIEACTAHKNLINEVQVREEAEEKLKKTAEKLSSGEKELQRLYGESEQARKSLLTILEDVTQKEKALKVSESKLNSILSSINDLVFVFDQEGRFIFTHASAFEQLYTAPDEFLGKKLSEVMPSHLNKILLDAFDKIRKGQVAEYDYWLKIKDKTLWFSAKHSPRFVDGELVGSVSVVRDITERKLVEQELSNANYIINRSPAVALQWKNEKEWPVEFASDNVINLYGYSAADFISGKVVYDDIIHPDDLERVRKEIIDTCRNKHSESFIHKPYRIITKSKETRWIEDRTTIIRDIKGAITHYQGVIIDITDKISMEEDKKQTLKTLIRSEESLKDAQKTALIWRWEQDLVNNQLFWDPEIYELFEIDPKKFDASREGFLNAIHPDDRTRVDRAYTDSVKNKTPYEITHRLLLKGGKVKYVNEKCHTEYDSKGNPVRSIGIVQDITELEIAHEKVARFSRIFEDTLNEIYIFDAVNYRFIEANQAAQKNLGYSMKELLKLTALDIKPEYDKTTFNNLLKPLREKKKEKILFYTKHRRKSGVLYPVEVHMQMNFCESRQTYTAIILDITERKKVEDELKKYRDHLKEQIDERTLDLKNQAKKLEESQTALTYLLEDMNEARNKTEETNIKLINANKELESFSYSVSHDLRAPLRAIIGFSAKFNSQYNAIVDEEGKRLLSVISRSALKMGRLIDDLLTFSRMSRTEIRKLNVNLKSLAEEAWLEIEEQTEGRDIQIEIKTLPDAKGDRNMLKQVYINLLSNSVKFSKSDESNVIEVGADLKDGDYIYYVKDSGVGFEMKYVEKLFQVFQRLHSEKEFEGTGVGLALVQRIISKHEGKVWAESEVGEGAIFYFTLPT